MRCSAGGAPGLGQHKPDQQQAATGNRGKAQERSAATEMIEGKSGKRGAQRGADAHRAADDAEPEVEAARTAGDIGHHERKRHAEHGGADAVEGLHGNNQIGIGDEDEQDASDGQRPETEFKVGAAPTDRLPCRPKERTGRR